MCFRVRVIGEGFPLPSFFYLALRISFRWPVSNEFAWGHESGKRSKKAVAGVGRMLLAPHSQVLPRRQALLGE